MKSITLTIKNKNKNKYKRMTYKEAIEQEINVRDLYVLTELLEKGEIPISSLQMKNITTASLTGIADRLSMRRLLVRKRSELDRRCILLSLTEKGRSLFPDKIEEEEKIELTE